MPHLNKNLTNQVDALTLHTDRPLIVADADEVLLQFVCGLERFLEQRNLWLDLTSYKLLGNVKESETGEPIPPESLQVILRDFFTTESGNLDPVDGAAASLQAFTGRAQIVVLSNVPSAQREQREALLHGHGMPYPVIANEGLKDEAMVMLAERAGVPVFLLDDIPHHLTATKERLPDCHCIHLIGDPRLSALVPDQTPGTYRAADWTAAAQYIETTLIQEAQTSDAHRH